MPNIRLNATGTHVLNVTPDNLLTIAHFGLFDGLVPSTGVVDETTLEKLRHVARGLLASPRREDGESTIASTADGGADWYKLLLDLCLDVLYHDKMKAYGLRQLMRLYDETASGLTE